jgi:RNA polymerase primary sigma factor
VDAYVEGVFDSFVGLLEIACIAGNRVEKVRMVSIAAASREGRRVTTATRERKAAPVKDVEFERSEPQPVSFDPLNDNVPLPSEDVEHSAELLDTVEQVGDFLWDQEESEALRQARKDAELTTSVDSVRAYLKQIGKIALLNADEEVELAKRIEASFMVTKV